MRPERPSNVAGPLAGAWHIERRCMRGSVLGAVLSLLAVTAGWSATGANGRSTRPSRSSVPCAASVVHYARYPGAGPGLAHLPWVAAAPTATGIVGHLFYYDNQNVWNQDRLPRLRIYSGGQSPDGQLNMKILWQTKHSGAVVLDLHGDRLDGRGSFSQQLSPAASNTRQFPSIVTVPTVGCWRLTLTAGATTGQVTVVAVRGRTT